MDFFVGTLTREGGEGILRCRIENGHMRRLQTLTEITDPNYVILSKDQTRLYAVNSDTKQGDFSGCVNVYDITGDHPILLARRETAGNGPCFLALSPNEQYLYVTNYGTGSLAVFSTNEGLSERIQQIQHHGCGPHPTRQAGPHLHQVTLIPKTRYLCAVDLGTDELVTYRRDPDNGLLTEHARVHLHGGPRHIAYSCDGMAYLVHELSNEVTVLRIEDGHFTPLQTLSTLPSDTNCANTAAAISLSSDGKHLYVSNRGLGTLAVYNIQTDGTLSPCEQLFVGVFPRDFVQLDDGTFLVADQRAGVYYLNEHGEPLDFIPQTGAVCVCCKA